MGASGGEGGADGILKLKTIHDKALLRRRRTASSVDGALDSSMHSNSEMDYTWSDYCDRSGQVGMSDVFVYCDRLFYARLHRFP